MSDALHEVLDELVHRGFDEVEVFHKTGRSRTHHYRLESAAAALRHEEGWAVRAGDRRRSFFFAASGAPRAGAAWPEADGAGLRLPSARPVPRWTPPSSLDLPLIGESEALALFAALGRELAREMPGSRLLAGHLDDGSSESELLSSREVAAVVRQRAAVLWLQAAGPERDASAITLEIAERDARRFSPAAIARRLADRLSVASRGSAPERDRGEIVLASEVTVALLGALLPLWIGAEAPQRLAPLVDRRGRLGSPLLTLIDDGRLPGGLLEAPVDGEGQPTREVVLIDKGVSRQPLVAWFESAGGRQSPSGCCRRPGWRDLPRPGPTHFYLRPDPSTPAAALVGAIRRGYYLLAPSGAPRVADDLSRFALPVYGFSIEGGRSTGALAGAWLTGAVSSFLGGIQALGRDLTFLPAEGGLIGAPTLLTRGLELRQRRP